MRAISPERSRSRSASLSSPRLSLFNPSARASSVWSSGRYLGARNVASIFCLRSCGCFIRTLRPSEKPMRLKADNLTAQRARRNLFEADEDYWFPSFSDCSAAWCAHLLHCQWCRKKEWKRDEGELERV